MNLFVGMFGPYYPLRMFLWVFLGLLPLVRLFVVGIFGPYEGLIGVHDSCVPSQRLRFRPPAAGYEGPGLCWKSGEARCSRPMRGRARCFFLLLFLWGGGALFWVG